MGDEYSSKIQRLSYLTGGYHQDHPYVKLEKMFALPLGTIPREIELKCLPPREKIGDLLTRVEMLWLIDLEIKGRRRVG